MTRKKGANKYALCFWNSPFIGIMVIIKIFTISKKEKKPNQKYLKLTIQVFYKMSLILNT